VDKDSHKLILRAVHSEKSETTAGKVEVKSSEQTTDEVVEKIPEQASEKTSGTEAEAVSGRVSEEVSVSAPEDGSEPVSEEASVSAPEEVSEIASEPVPEKKAEKQATGIILKNIFKRRCPVCNELVCFEDAVPLSMFDCPLCGNKIMVPGRVDNFVLHSHIGEGEMGTIFKATDDSLDREVAVKVVRGCHADDPAQRERLHREACAAGKLNHPRVAQVYALNFSNGNPYLVMELVSGSDFSEKLEKEGPLNEEAVLRMALDVAEGLSALHREGLVHGDIKPANIVLDRDGNAKLVDFGLSGMMRHDGHGNLVGTPHYLAPEILRGAPDSHRTDIYSLGGTLYYLLCGRLPFDGVTPAETLKARLKEDPIPLDKFAPHVSSGTCAMIMRMLERDPEKRFENSEAIASNIKSALKKLKDPDDNKPDKVVSLADISKAFPVVERRVPVHKSRVYFLLVLLFIAVVEMGIAYKQRSFPATWRWMRDDVGGWIKTVVAYLKGENEKLSTGPVYEWNSVTMGDFLKRSSTMQFGEKLILQCSGKDMWSGAENYRFFKVDCEGNYSFAMKVLEISANNDYDISGMLVKNQNLSDPSGILFGFLGSGHLFLQVRGKSRTAEVVKCMKNVVALPAYLKIVRDGRLFTTFFSSDGEDWSEFASCEMDLKSGNAVGAVVSSQHPESVALAKFSSVFLQFPAAPAIIPTNAVPLSTSETLSVTNSPE